MNRSRRNIVYICSAIGLVLICSGYIQLIKDAEQKLVRQERVDHERMAISLAAIKSMGGRTYSDSRIPGRPITEVTINHDYAVTDNDLKVFKDLPELQSLRIYNCQLTADGLAHLQGLTKLITLDLYGGITNDGIGYIRKLTSLRILHLIKTNITDEGLVHLRSLTNLEVLYIDRADVGDSGLKYFEALTGLRKLYLIDTLITDQGIAKLSRTMHSTTIYTKDDDINAVD